MKAVITFNWRGQQIEQFVEWDSIVNDINDKDSFWGEFILNGIKYQYQILWESSIITIFVEGGVEYIDKVDNFQLSFSKMYK